MASKMGAITDAVAAVLNQDPPPVAIGATAVPTWRASWTAVELAELRVAVTPGPAAYTRTSRATLLAVPSTDLIFAKRVDPTVNSQVDALAAIAEAAAEYFAETYASAHLVSGDVEAKLVEPPRFVSPDEAAVDAKLLGDQRVALLAVRLTWWM